MSVLLSSVDRVLSIMRHKNSLASERAWAGAFRLSCEPRLSSASIDEQGNRQVLQQIATTPFWLEPRLLGWN